MVGAILVDETGKILSQGYHHKAGSPHAEVNALQGYGEVPPTSILFVTLEPCSHTGKTPPCVDLVIQKKVKTVVIGTRDPNPRVSGRGIEKLKSHGITVVENICQQECWQMNKVFNKHILEKIPYVSIKAAATLDGKIAMPSGESQWITGKAARSYGHILRSQHQAIVVGSGTLLADDPALTDRTSEKPRHPHRIVFSSKGLIPKDSKFLNSTDTRRIVIAGNNIEKATVDQLQKAGVELLIADTDIPGIEWSLKSLYTAGICSLLLEGGAQLAGSFLKENMMDQLYLFIAGKLIGSQSAPSWCGELELNRLSDAPELEFQNIERLGDDILLTCIPKQ